MALVSLVAESGKHQVKIDDMTQVLEIISDAHHEIHEGVSYKADLNTTDLDSNPLVITFTTPDTTKWAHLLILASASGQAQMEIQENPDTVANGTALPIYNRNRNSTNTSAVISTHNSTVGQATQGATVTLGSGIILHHEVFGSGKDKISGESRDTNEFILKQNTTYVITMTSITNSIVAQLTCNWYEHTNSTGAV